MIGKRGAMEAETLVKIIIAIIGFGILLFIYSQLNWNGAVDKKICHESVIIRGTLPMMAQDIVALKCKPENICVTTGILNKDCKTMKNTGGVKTVGVKDIKGVEKVIATEVVDCWKMMGEGKLSLFSQKMAQIYGLGKVVPTCVICSRIGFNAQKLNEANINLANMNVKNYMDHYIMAGTNSTYTRLIAQEDGKVNVGSSVNLKDIEVKVDDKGAVKASAVGGVSLDTAPIDTAQKPSSELQSSDLAVVFMQITAPKYGEVFRNTLASAGIGLAGSFSIAPTKTISSLRVLANPYVLATLAIAGVGQYGLVVWNREVSAGVCGDVSIGDEAREGCSVVRTMNYDMKEIAKYCTILEGLPA